MNVSKIQKLSEQHKSLKQFHEVCNHNNVELSVKVAGQSNATDLDYVAAKTIIAKVRGILLDRIKAIEENITQEATKL